VTQPPDVERAVERAMVRRVLVGTVACIAVAVVGLWFVLRPPSGPRTGPVGWHINPGDAPIASSQAVRVHVEQDDECGRVADRLVPPVVRYEPARVVIVLRARVAEPGTFRACGQSISDDVVTVQLQEPLGNREAVDGSRL
jgi:hypothetical protein